MKEAPKATAKEAKPTPQDWKAFRVAKAANKKKQKAISHAAQVRRDEKAERREEDKRAKEAWAARDPDAASQARNQRAREAKKEKKKQQQQQQMHGAVDESPVAEPVDPIAAANVEDDLNIYEDEEKGSEVAPLSAAYVCPGRLNAQWDDSRKAILKQ